MEIETKNKIKTGIIGGLIGVSGLVFSQIGNLEKKENFDNKPVAQKQSETLSQTSDVCDGVSNDFSPQPTPEKTLELENKLLSSGKYCYNLSIFDEEWRKRGSKMILNEQYKNTANMFNMPRKTVTKDKIALVYFPNNPELGPEFLYKSDDGWVIDRTEVWNNVHYSYDNSEWYVYDNPSPYLSLLKNSLDLERIKLDSGQYAYRLK